MPIIPQNLTRPAWLVMFALLAGGTAYGVWHVNSEGLAKAATPAIAPRPMTISVASAVRREIAQSIPVSGTLVARDEVLVGARVEGLRLEEYLVDIGDEVEAGQVLARLDRAALDTQLERNASEIAKAEAAIAHASAAINEAEASEVEARAALGRAQTLKQSGNVTDETLQARETAARVASARVGAQRQNLRIAEAEKGVVDAQRRELSLSLARAEVRAPTAGIISHRAARIGQAAGLTGEPLFRIISAGAVELEASVPEARLHTVEPGQLVIVELPGQAKPVLGSVRLVSPVIDPATRLGSVHISLMIEAMPRPGMFARATIETEHHNGLVIPRSAVLVGVEGPRVQVIENGVVATRDVTLGVTDAGGIEIIKGLEPGEDVVARAGGFLRDGNRITAVPLLSVGLN